MSFEFLLGQRELFSQSTVCESPQKCTSHFSLWHLAVESSSPGTRASSSVVADGRFRFFSLGVCALALEHTHCPYSQPCGRSVSGAIPAVGERWFLCLSDLGVLSGSTRAQGARRQSRDIWALPPREGCSWHLRSRKQGCWRQPQCPGLSPVTKNQRTLQVPSATIEKARPHPQQAEQV